MTMKSGRMDNNMRRNRIKKSTSGVIKRVITFFMIAVVSGIFLTSCGSAEQKKELSFTEIEQLAANGVFIVNWNTTEGEYSAGTSYVMDSEKHGRLLVTLSIICGLMMQRPSPAHSSRHMFMAERFIMRSPERIVEQD